MVGSGLIEPSGCGMPSPMRAVMRVSALPMSICPPDDVVFAPVQRDRSREHGHRMLGGGIRRRVWPRHMGGNGAVVDDAPALRMLVHHHADCMLGAQESPGEVHINHPLPLLEGEVLHGYRRGTRTGIVEKQVEAAKGFPGSFEQRRDRLRIADIRLPPPAHEYRRPTLQPRLRVVRHAGRPIPPSSLQPTAPAPCACRYRTPRRL